MDDHSHIHRQMVDPPDEMWEISKREMIDTISRSKGFFVMAICESEDEPGELEAVCGVHTGPDLMSLQVLTAAQMELWRVTGMISQIGQEDEDA